MFLAIYLHRRSYVSGYGYLWQNVELPKFAQDRLRLSIEFAANPTNEVKTNLINQGVRYFVLDKTLKYDPKLFNYARVLRNSERFQLLYLL